MTKFLSIAVVLSVIIVDAFSATLNPIIPIGTAPPPPKQDWNDVLSCESDGKSRCGAICGVTPNPNFQKFLACRIKYIDVARKFLESCIPGAKTDKCLRYIQKINDPQFSPNITDPLLTATWSCLNNNCASLDTCTTICPPTTTKNRAATDKFAACFEEKANSARKELKKCFEDEFTAISNQSKPK